MTSVRNLISAITAAAALCIYVSVPAQVFPSDGESDLRPGTDTLAAPEGYFFADSTIIRFASPLDTALAGKNIFSALPLKENGDAANVRVHQSQEIRLSLLKHISSNYSRPIEGYRVRIFFDNKQTSRTASESTRQRFMEKYPEIPVYRSHVNPYFKVTVGDFRSKSEAMQLLRRISGEFPTAFIVKEDINYPAVDRKNPVVKDTVRVLRPVANSEISL